MLAAVVVPAIAGASGIPTATPLEEVIVTASRIGLVGESRAASEGIVPAIQLEGRPVLRPGEVLEVVPGLVVTQHSGDGKANQYFLRGFNLDHGTDFATSVDGIPVNMPTHAHGQGYADINFLIPELVDEVRYRKGTYFADEGNFAAAGAADIVYRRRLDAPFVGVTVGEDDYYRALLAGAPEVAGGVLLGAIDYSTADGPWDLPQDFRKVNGLAKYSRGDSAGGLAVTAMGYDGQWHSTDQIPLRATRAGCEQVPFCISRFGYVDPTNGGESHRYSLSFDGWSRDGDGGGWTVNAYGMDYHLQLISNFTYALDSVNGDQFEQYDDRRVFGGRFEYAWPVSLISLPGALRAGAELRRDDIEPVGLFLTTQGERRETVREDDVTQTSYSAYLAHDQRWNDWLRTELGLRFDYFDFEVDSNVTANSGNASDSIVQPKLSVVLGPWAETEVFLNYGRGFHSNDARGTTIRVDPVDGVTPVERVDPLVAADGAEIGVRSAAWPGLQVYGAFWGLDIDSELLFVGDGGITEPNRASRRYGVELGAFWTPLDWLIVDVDYAWAHARFRGNDPAGDYIPGAVEDVASVGITVNRPDGWFGGARLRYFGEAPLIEDDSVRSDPTFLVNVEAGYRFSERLSAFVTVFNVFDAEDNDITYFYESQLPGEAAPVEDIHFHPVEPRTVRGTLTLQF
ncbi:TonB-dependent outer membrane receptor [sediment metagenome]|uniref:TonB-dependent outer membrane receptor n=1 Tax=sediment metagenome TaxID=749907 RepID=D9PIS7_9ZZZZ